jgi:hypothetical protein
MKWTFAASLLITVRTSDTGSSIVYVTGTFQPDDDKTGFGVHTGPPLATRSLTAS